MSLYLGYAGDDVFGLILQYICDEAGIYFVNTHFQKHALVALGRGEALRAENVYGVLVHAALRIYVLSGDLSHYNSVLRERGVLYLEETPKGPLIILNGQLRDSPLMVGFSEECGAVPPIHSGVGEDLNDLHARIVSGYSISGVLGSEVTTCISDTRGTIKYNAVLEDAVRKKAEMDPNSCSEVDALIDRIAVDMKKPESYEDCPENVSTLEFAMAASVAIKAVVKFSRYCRHSQVESRDSYGHKGVLEYITRLRNKINNDRVSGKTIIEDAGCLYPWESYAPGGKGRWYGGVSGSSGSSAMFRKLDLLTGWSADGETRDEPLVGHERRLLERARREDEDICEELLAEGLAEK